MSGTANRVFPQLANLKPGEKLQVNQLADLKPGEKLQVGLQEKYYAPFQSMIKKAGFENSGSAKDATIWIDRINYSDGTMWAYGKYYQRDSNNSKKWIPISTLSINSDRNRQNIPSLPKKITEIQTKEFVKNTSKASSPHTQVCYEVDEHEIDCMYDPNCQMVIAGLAWRTTTPPFFVSDGFVWDSCTDIYTGNWCYDYLVELFELCW